MHKCKSTNLTSFFLLILIFANSVFSVVCFGKDCEVSERELLILTLITYANNIKTDNASDVLTEKYLERFEISNKTITPNDVKDWKIVGYEINPLPYKDGFSVFTFKKDNNVVVIPRGSDGGVVRENWKYLFRDEHPQAKYMKDYMEKSVIPFLLKSYQDEDYKVYICGHSLGGYLALYGAGIFLENREVANFLEKVVTFNGLGLDKSTNRNILSKLNELPAEKILNYRINGDSISLIGEHFTKPVSFKLVQSPYLKKPSKWIFIIGYTFFAHKLSQFFLHTPFICNEEQKEAC